jgi:translocation and assembly module TamB
LNNAPKPKRTPWRAAAAGGVLAVAGAGIAIGPGAQVIVDQLADGVRIWRLGYLEVGGVSGTWLGDLRAERLSIADNEGVWIEARGVALRWSPLNIAFGAVKLSDVRADALTVHRQPVLLERRPSANAYFDVRIDALRADQIVLAQAVFGVEARFNANMMLDVRGRSLRALDLTLNRLDSDADHLSAQYRDMGVLNAALESASETGVIARALGFGERGVRASAASEGAAEAGAIRFAASAGADHILDGALQWTAAGWSSHAQANLAAAPALATLARRIGADATFTASGQRGAGAFNAHARTSFLAVDITGELDEARALSGPARITATAARLSDIARESPFELGPATLVGELRQARGTTAIRGALTAQNIQTLGRAVDFSGPVEAMLTREAFALDGDLRAINNVPALFQEGRLRTALGYDRIRRRFELQQAELTSAAMSLNASGWVVGGDGEFSGDWRVRKLEAFAPRMTGEANGSWRAFRQDAGRARVWATTIATEDARLDRAPPLVAQLLGRSPRFDARMRYENRGVSVSYARLEGVQLRAGATGRIVRGVSDLVLEASVREPLALGGASLDGAADLTGAITGPFAQPSITARALLANLNVFGVAVEQPVLTLTLAPSARAYNGRATLEGQASGQAIASGADIAMAANAVSLTQLDAQWGALQAQGSAQVSNGKLSANLDVNGVIDGLAPGASGRVAGNLALASGRVSLRANFADARFGELRAHTATLNAEGPLDAIAAQIEMRGHLRRAPLTFSGAGVLDVDGAARIEGRGALAGVPIYTRAPIEARWSKGHSTLSLNVAINGGVVRAQWEERGRALHGRAEIADAPLAPLAAIWGERATGRIDGALTIDSAGRGLSGDANLTFANAHFASRQDGTLDLRIVGQLAANRLTGSVDAASQSGLVAHFEADAPVETNAAPIRIALARERRGQARWSVTGPADALWAAARLPDQSLAGALSGEGELSFGAGSLSGDGHIEIADGRFQDKLTGVTLANLNARLAIGERGVSIERFTATGPRGGTVTATGGSTNPRSGGITLQVSDMRLVDRPDAEARGSGMLTLAWEGLHSTLSGALEIEQANLDVAASPHEGIPVIDVTEVNRPESDTEFAPEEPRPQRNGSTRLDVRITAPGRVFTRGRGLETEWSLDMRVAGTARQPRILGVAAALRGTLALSGQAFEIEDATIRFDGDPMDAHIDLTAVRDTADLSARIRLLGTARDPEITFSSDPPLPEDEILPQVLFGRSVEDLSAFEAAQLAASLATLSGRASLDLVDAARAAAGLDRFNVRQDGESGFLVAGGVYLTRDVYVEVARTGLGQAQSTVEWTVRPRLVLITSFLGNGDRRISLRWRRETD